MSAPKSHIANARRNQELPTPLMPATNVRTHIQTVGVSEESEYASFWTGGEGLDLLVGNTFSWTLVSRDFLPLDVVSILGFPSIARLLMIAAKGMQNLEKNLGSQCKVRTCE